MLTLPKDAQDLGAGQSLSQGRMANDLSQPRVPGLSPPSRAPASPTVPSEEWPSGLLLTPTWPWEADPSPRSPLGSQQHTPGNTHPPGHRRKSLAFCLWACVSVFSPASSRGFPTHPPHPPQNLLTAPPPPHLRSSQLFLAHGGLARPLGTWGYRGTSLPQPGRQGPHAHFTAAKTGAREAQKLDSSLMAGKWQS